MKRQMWQFSVAIAAVAISVSYASAAGRQASPTPMSPADHAKARVGIIAAAVGNLTDDEKAKMQAIYEKAYQSQVDLRAKNADAESVRDVMEKADSDAKEVLTGDQKSKFPSGRALRAAG